MMMMAYTKKNAHAVPLASARQHPENQKENQVENQAGPSAERTMEGQPPVLNQRRLEYKTRSHGRG